MVAAIQRFRVRGAPLTLRARLVIIMLLTTLLVAFTFQLVASVALNRLHDAESADARAHFTGRTAAIDQEWCDDSAATRQLIESWLSTSGESKRELRDTTLHSLLKTILAQDDFSHVVIVDARRGVLFRHGFAGRDAPSKEKCLLNMSHEIRTPMNGMLGARELRSLTSLTAQQTEFMNVATLSGEALLEIINQVLDYAKVGAGQLNLACEPLDINAIARSVVTLFSASAQRKSIALRLDADPVP